MKQDIASPPALLLKTVEGREVHDRWFSSIENHTVLRYIEGWGRIQSGDE